MKASSQTGSLVLVAHRGDAKTLLAFDIVAAADRKNLAGFSIRVTPPGKDPYYLLNRLGFADPSQHAQMAGEPQLSSANAPFHKFRWVHVPGQFHQGLTPAWGNYVYDVTPRYFDGAGHLLELDPTRTATVTVEVAPFEKDALRLGFTRGFTQSQAFTHHFGKNAKLRPAGKALQFDTSQVCGTNDAGEPFTYVQQYEWSGFTARQCIFELLDEAVADPSIHLDLFAYDLIEPDFIARLLTLAGQQRARVILDNADLHHDPTDPQPEDQFADLFAAAAGAGAIKRGRFGRYAHDKVIILRRGGAAYKVLTGSTNFSITGMYVNSNHVLVFDDATVAGLYGDVFDAVWAENVGAGAFRKNSLSTEDHPIGSAGAPKATISFSPHDEARASEVLNRIVVSATAQTKDQDGLGNVMFAVMELGSTAPNPVYTTLTALHQDTNLFSFGISDDPDGISLFEVGSPQGVLVTGKPKDPILPPPFDQVRGVGAGHQVHHKFVVCGFDTDGITFCGSSNLAVGGEKQNGDNLLMITDQDVSTAFAIEAISLVDHFNFLDGLAKAPAPAGGAHVPSPPPANLAAAAASSGWHLGTDDQWCAKYFDTNDLHSKDRQIFARSDAPIPAAPELTVTLDLPVN
jgi:hypothetical protein